LNYKKIKKGQGAVGAIITFVLVVVFIFGFIMINNFGQTVIDEFVPEFTEANGYSNESIAPITNVDNNYGGLVDGIGMFILIGLWILIFILAYNSSQSPFVGFLAIILVVIIALVGMIFSNTWEDMTSDSDFGNASTNFPMLNFVLTNYLLWVIVIGFTMVIGFFMGSQG